MIGCRIKNIIKAGIRKTLCSIFTHVNRKNLPVPPHACQINWPGSSGSMESGMALSFVINVFKKTDGRVSIGVIVSDDNCTMRIHYKQGKDGGKLPNHIPTPMFLAEPSHRIKCMAKPIFKLVSSTPVKDPRRCKVIDATQMEKYISCMVSKNRNLPIDQFLPKAKVLLEHLFNRHH